MEVGKAKLVLADANSTFAEKYRATIAIVEKKDVQLVELLDCLNVQGMPAELAAMKLYQVTGRAREPASTAIDVDRESWERFLRESRD